MNALHLGPGGPVLSSDYPVPQPAPGEALVRVVLAGICATDLELIHGYAGFTGVLGHELVGVVERASDPAWLGRRVVATINVGCGHCPLCRSEGPEHCARRTVLGIHGRDGAFAQWLAVPECNLLEVPDRLQDEQAVFTEPLAAALRIREQVAVTAATRTAVVGPGRLGLLIAQVLALASREVTVLGRSRESLALPARLGLETGIAAEAAANAFDLVVEATGNAAGLAESLRLVRPRGTLVLKSTFHGAAEVDLTKLVVGEVKVVGSRCGPFAPALELLAAGAIAVEPLVEAEYPLAQALRALAHAAAPGARKILLRP
jgi:threonine dehydrogenase-like Zn-dependent dehydrogenase